MYAAMVCAFLVSCQFSGHEIEVGQTIQGELENGDETVVFDDGSYTDLYEIKLSRGQRVIIDIASSSFDTYAAVFESPGKAVAKNDDYEPGNTNSRITYTAQDQRTYFIAATSLRSGKTGLYEVSVKQLIPSR